MKQSKHTPGPWYPIDWNPMLIVSDHGQFGGTNICSVHDRANAKLIAAAPEMLEALKKASWQLSELVNYLGNEVESFDEGSDEHRLTQQNLIEAQEAEREVNKAIKKATE